MKRSGGITSIASIFATMVGVFALAVRRVSEVFGVDNNLQDPQGDDLRGSLSTIET